MKLNLGSSDPRGKYRHRPWICCDLNPQGRPHVVGDGFSLPFRDDSFDEIHSIHVLEHLQRDQWPLMLCEMFRVLEPEGYCYVEVPDFPKQCSQYLAQIGRSKTGNAHLCRTAIWGKSERPGMGHQFGFDEGLLHRAMVKTGFDQVTHLTDKKNMVSTHYKRGPVLLFKSTKIKGIEPKFDIPSMDFDQLRNYIIQ